MDLSFSFVENANETQPLPASESTPKRGKREFVCIKCGKKYVSQFYYNKHILSHVAERHDDTLDQSNTSCRSNVSLQEKDVSFGALQPAAPSQFKEPAVRKQKRKPKFVCTFCRKGYVCNTSFETHMMIHTIQNAASRYPKKEIVLGNIKEISVLTMSSVCAAPSCGQQGAKFHELTTHISSMQRSEDFQEFATELCSQLMECVVGQRFLLPSTLLGTLVDQVEKVLSNRELCSVILNKLRITDSTMCESDALNQFFLEYTLQLSKEIISFISNSVRQHDLRPCRVMPEIDSEDREVIYCIGGSSFRGYLRLAYRYKKNETWARISEVIKTNVLSDDPAKERDSSWTVAVNRGGLLFISAKCQEFLVSLTKVVFSNEKPDGSIDFEEVIRCVTTSEMCVLWDTVLSCALTENVFLNLMNDVIKFFCRTCGRGFAKQRLNRLREKPMISLTTRHLAAIRKGRK